MRRLDVLDGMRGYFLIFMVLNHLVLQGGLWLAAINHRQLMFVEDAQGFVFLSGMLIGLVQAARMRRHGYAAMRRSVLRRAFELYCYAMVLVVAAIAARTLLPGGVEAFGNWVGFAPVLEPLRAMAIATLLFQPTFMDILPQYILYLLVSPVLIRMVLAGGWAWVMTLSILCWMAAQLSLAGIGIVPLQGLVAASDGQGVRIAFDPMGWQLVFMTGLVLGTMTSAGRIDWSRILTPQNTTIPGVALLVMAFFVPLRIATANGLLPGDVLSRFATMEIRSNFGPVYLLNFVAAGTLMTWLLMAGPLCANEGIRRVSLLLRGLFTLAPLRLLGRHSLQIYAVHVVVVYAARYLDARIGPLGQPAATLVALGAVGLVFLPSLWRERVRWWAGSARTASLRAVPAHRVE